MVRWRQVFYTVITIIVFFILTVIASVEYSDEQKELRAKENIVYRLTTSVVDFGEKTFNSWPLKAREENANHENLERESWGKRLEQYFQISREKEGLTIIMTNSKGEINELIWPIFKKIKE